MFIWKCCKYKDNTKGEPEVKNANQKHVPYKIFCKLKDAKNIL